MQSVLGRSPIAEAASDINAFGQLGGTHPFGPKRVEPRHTCTNQHRTAERTTNAAPKYVLGSSGESNQTAYTTQ